MRPILQKLFLRNLALRAVLLLPGALSCPAVAQVAGSACVHFGRAGAHCPDRQPSWPRAEGASAGPCESLGRAGLRCPPPPH